MEDFDLTTQEGVVSLMRTSKDEAEWANNCDKVKEINGGYPKFWFSSIITSGLMNKILGPGSDEIKIIDLSLDKRK